MAESRFDRPVFVSRLATRWVGRALIALDRAASTNDAAWEALAGGAPDGVAVVTDVQTRGRGRAGRAWHTAAGKGLALSVGFARAAAARPPGLVPLAAGLALARGLERLGVGADLKWPNDLLLGGRKLAGVLAESRRGATDAVVIGVGVNVAERPEDFPAGLGGADDGGAAAARPLATSLAIEGWEIAREAVAAEFLNQLEPLWLELTTRGGPRLLEAWRDRARFWGSAVSVHSPAGRISGVATTLDPDGALVITEPGGGRRTVFAGDLELAPASAADRP